MALALRRETLPQVAPRKVVCRYLVQDALRALPQQAADLVRTAAQRAGPLAAESPAGAQVLRGESEWDSGPLWSAAQAQVSLGLERVSWRLARALQRVLPKQARQQAQEPKERRLALQVLLLARALRAWVARRVQALAPEALLQALARPESRRELLRRARELPQALRAAGVQPLSRRPWHPCRLWPWQRRLLPRPLPHQRHLECACALFRRHRREWSWSAFSFR